MEWNHDPQVKMGNATQAVVTVTGTSDWTEPELCPLGRGAFVPVLTTGDLSIRSGAYVHKRSAPSPYDMPLACFGVGSLRNDRDMLAEMRMPAPI